MNMKHCVYLIMAHNLQQNSNATAVCLNNQTSSIRCYFGLQIRNTTAQNYTYTYSNPPWNAPNEPSKSINEQCIQITAWGWHDKQCIQQTNTFGLCNYPPPHFFLLHFTQQTIPSFDNSISTMDILDEISVEIDILIHSFASNNDTLSILHIGNQMSEKT
eukprot:369931_1